MNIFVLDLDPRQAAADQCDKHVVKMILETAQILSTVHHGYGSTAPYKATHRHHPSTRWAAASKANYDWLHAHLRALLAEYTDRYGKQHAVETKGVVHALLAPPPGIPDVGLTPFAQAMPDEYRRPDDPVAAYRAYYQGAKADFARWKTGKVPGWFRPTV